MTLTVSFLSLLTAVLSLTAGQLEVTCPSTSNVNVTEESSTSGLIEYDFPMCEGALFFATLSCSPTPGSIVQLPITSLTCTCVEATGRSATCTTDLTGLGSQVEILNCPLAREVTVNEIPGSSQWQFIYQLPVCRVGQDTFNATCFPPSAASVVRTVNSITCSCVDVDGTEVATCTVDQNVSNMILTLPAGIDNMPVDFPEPFVPGLTLISSSHQPRSSRFCWGTTEVTYLYVNMNGDFSCVFFNVILEGGLGSQLEILNCPSAREVTVNEVPGSSLWKFMYQLPVCRVGQDTFNATCFPPSAAIVVRTVNSITCSCVNVDRREVATCTVDQNVSNMILTLPAGIDNMPVDFPEPFVPGLTLISSSHQPRSSRFCLGTTEVTYLYVNMNGDFSCVSFNVILEGVVEQSQTCLEGWHEINGRCFLEVSGPNLPDSFESRRLECLRRRGDLARFERWGRFSSLLPTFFTFPEYYIGLTDLDAEGDFRWVVDNTTPSMPFPWAISQPNGGSFENCVTVVNPQAPVWSDTSCNRRLPFICERPAEIPRNCGTGPLASRIIGGNDADEGEWPWHGALEVFGINICGATLISEEWAITSPQCLGINRVVFGDRRQLNDPPSPYRQESEVTWFIHPGYNPFTFENDIALLYLHTPVTFTSFVRPACVYNTVVNPDLFPPEVVELTNCHITGWGAVSNDFDFPNILQEAPLDILPPLSCANYGADFIPQIMLCAGNDDSSVDTCVADGGGALICQRTGGSPIWYLTGITSFGDESGCAVAGFPGVYTRIATTRQFVRNTQTLASTLFSCADSSRVLLENQVCDNIVDCDDYSDEIGCDPLRVGQAIQLNSPKFGSITNLINRQWIYSPSSGRLLTVSITLNTLPGSGTLVFLTNISSETVSQLVPFVNQGGLPILLSGSGVGQPVVLSMDKTAVNSVAGFQATING